MKNILFATPFFGFTGSEIALYNIIRHWSDSEQTQLFLSSIEHGPLLDSPNINIQCFCYKDSFSENNTLSKRVLKKVTNRIKYDYEIYLNKIFKDSNPDVCVLNTLIMTQYIPYLKKKKIPSILYVHEMDWTFSHFSGNELKDMVELPDMVICCSEASANGFRKIGRKHHLQVVYPGVDFSSIYISKKREQMLASLGISNDSKIIGMSGSLDKNKDPLMFVETANELLQKDGKYHFIWIGGNLNTGDYYYASCVAKSYGIEKKVKFVGYQKEDYYNYLNAIDVFFLTSVHDSFPLVMIEAGYLKKPVIGFNSGGINEFVKQKTGLIISERNSVSAAEAIDRYLKNINQIFDEEICFNNALAYSAENSAFNFKTHLESL